MSGGEEYVYFTDASYSPQQKIGVAGFQLRGEEVKTVVLDDSPICKNTQLEILASRMALEHAIKRGISNFPFTVYTDCQKVIQLYEGNSKKEDHQHDLFCFALQKCKHVSFCKVKGHSPGRDKSAIDIEFKVVDKAVRKRLRQAVQEKKNQN